MNTQNLSFFIKDLKVLVMSRDWDSYEKTIDGFNSVAHNFGLKTPDGTMLTGKNLKFVISDDDASMLFGSKWYSYNVDIDKVFVWKNNMLLAVKNRKQLVRLMGDDKFVKAF